MPVSGEAAYSVDLGTDDVLQSGRPNTVSFTVRLNGSIVTPSSATFTLYANGSTDAVITSEAATIGVDGAASYTIAAAVLDASLSGRDYGMGWMEVWDVVIGGVTYQWSRPAAMALRPISPTVSDETLLAEHPDLLAYAANGTTTFQGFRDSAWNDITRRWLQEGGAFWPIASPGLFHAAHRELSLAKIWTNVAKSQGNDSLVVLGEQHRKQYEVEWSRVVAQYDRDQDGRLDDPDAVEASHPVIHRSSSRAYRTTYRRRGRGMLIR